MPTVLIADDSTTARMVIKRCLEIVGLSDWTFVEAGDGQEALDLLRAQPIDLLVTDVNMPVMDGKKLLLNVKASPRLNSIPVCIITSLGNPSFDAELKRIGAEVVLAKPISPQKLKEALDKILKKDPQP